MRKKLFTPHNFKVTQLVEQTIFIEDIVFWKRWLCFFFCLFWRPKEKQDTYELSERDPFYKKEEIENAKNQKPNHRSTV